MMQVKEKKVYFKNWSNVIEVHSIHLSIYSKPKSWKSIDAIPMVPPL